MNDETLRNRAIIYRRQQLGVDLQVAIATQVHRIRSAPGVIGWYQGEWTPEKLRAWYESPAHKPKSAY